MARTARTLLSTLACVIGCSPAQEEPAAARSMPRPYRGRLAAAVATNETCVGCHAEEAAEWSASRHHQASTNEAYREALAIEPSAFCRGCHAPESDVRSAVPQAVEDLGVGCVSCHVDDDGVVLAGARGATPPHPVRRAAALGTDGCAGCHEFRFPGADGDLDEQLMQTTMREHRRSSGSARACVDCHMPPREGRRSHAFAEVRDPAWLRASLSARAERAPGALRVTLAQDQPGHAFPTGDLFRRLEVGFELRGSDGSVMTRGTQHLARHFQLLPGTSRRQLARDDRVLDAPAELDFAIPGTRDGVARWWVKYQRVATAGVGTDPEDARVESEVLLHSGEVPWND